MTFEELESLSPGDIVVVTEIRGIFSLLLDIKVGDRLLLGNWGTKGKIFYFTKIGTEGDIYLSEDDICHIESIIKLRADKLNILGI